MTTPPDQPAPPSTPSPLEISLDPTPRWPAILAYTVLAMVVAVILIALLLQLNTSLRLAAIVVLFMLAYIAVVSYLASRKE